MPTHEEDIQGDLDRSIERIVKAEEQRASFTGFGNTKQGQALWRAYRGPLAQAIDADRFGLTGKEAEAAGGAVKSFKDLAGLLPARHRKPKHRAVSNALRGRQSNDIADLLLHAGLTIGTGDPSSPGDAGRAIGRLLGFKGKVALQVGMWGINMLLTLPNFVDEGGIPTLLLTDDTDDLLNEAVESAARVRPLLLPLAEPPVPWTGVRSGVTPPDHWAQPPLVNSHPSVERIWRKAISGNGQMRDVLDALNYLQSVPFVINQPILDLLNREPPLTVPDEPDPGLPRGKMWCAERLRRMAINLQNALSVDRAIASYLAFRPFYVPLSLDSRGRIYAIPHFGFAREDRVRALFLFANSAPIGVEGLRRLKAHVAGRADGITWSKNPKPSRLNLKGRVAWIDANISYLRDIGEAVLSGAPLAEEDLPPPTGDRYQFAAACAELVRAIDRGPDYPTQLPLTFDGSCSGLQHLCAMTRAEEGKFANLVPGDRAEDFYAHVASLVHEICGNLVGPDDRVLVKQPAMTYFYGSRMGGSGHNKHGAPAIFGMTEQVAEVLRERGQPEEDAERIAWAIYHAIEDLVPSAKDVRDFLEQLCKNCAKKGKHMRWTTPSGLPVVNCYYAPKIEDLSFTINGRRRRARQVVGDTDDLNTRKAVNAVTPNFVHSCDATHLHMIALAAQSEGIEMVSVHDSFGCLAPHAKRFNEIIREQLIRLYEEHDVLDIKPLPHGVELPARPKMGKLDLRQVIDSYHAFK